MVEYRKLPVFWCPSILNSQHLAKITEKNLPFIYSYLKNKVSTCRYSPTT
jgi:hypothetical protein